MGMEMPYLLKGTSTLAGVFWIKHLFQIIFYSGASYQPKCFLSFFFSSFENSSFLTPYSKLEMFGKKYSFPLVPNASKLLFPQWKSSVQGWYSHRIFQLFRHWTLFPKCFSLKIDFSIGGLIWKFFEIIINLKDYVSVQVKVKGLKKYHLEYSTCLRQFS